MSNIKTIVKVMNFQALIHVDSAHRRADKYLQLEKDVSRMINIIENNRNLTLDSKALKVNEKAPKLKIFVGSDLGFCGSINSACNYVLNDTSNDDVIIIIGRKLHSKKTPALSLSRDELENNYDKIEDFFKDCIVNKKYSEISIFYNHYYNMSHIAPVSKKIFPLDKPNDEIDESAYNDDFMIEGGDANDLLKSLMVTYLNYEMRSAIVNSYASENILREQATNESLRHIEEIERDEAWKIRKIKNAEATGRVIDSYVKTKYRER